MSYRRRLLQLLPVMMAMLVVPLAAGIHQAARAQAPAAVTIQNFAFVPPTLTVPVDTTVTWTQQDQIQHTVTSGEPGAADAGDIFDSPLLSRGQTFTFTFTEPGTYPYFCRPHPNMRGEIVVTEGAAAQPAPTATPTSQPAPTPPPAAPPGATPAPSPGPQQPPAMMQPPPLPANAQVIASGLDNPRGLTFAPDGALYVAEAGAGGEGVCVEGPEGGEICLGSSGAVTRIQSGRQERVATGLPSLASPEGGEATGPHDVAVRGGTVYAVVGLGADPARRADLGGDAAVFGTIVQLTGGGQWRPVADVAAYESRANPAGGDVDSNPYALLAEADRFVVADAGGNDLLAVNSDGSIETLAVFFSRMTAPPPFLMLPPGTEIPLESVPTSVVRGPDGAYYVGELTGFPFPQGGARIWRLVPGKSPSVFAEGFTNIIDLAFDGSGNLYVLEIATNGLLSMDPTGALHRIAPNGARTVVASEGLVMPGGVTAGPDGALYVTNFSVAAGEGQVVRITP